MAMTSCRRQYGHESITASATGPKSAPVTAVNELSSGLAWAMPGRAAGRLGRVGVAGADHADAELLVGYVESGSDGRDSIGRNSEEARSEARIDRSQQDQHAGHARVNPPVRSRPTARVSIGPAFVRLGVPIQVGLLAGPDLEQRRGRAHSLQPAARTFRSCGRPERVSISLRLTDQQGDSLGEASRWSTQRRSGQLVHQPGRKGPVGITSDHPAPSHSIPQLHRYQLPPNAATALSLSARQSVASSIPRACARKRAVCGMR